MGKKKKPDEQSPEPAVLTPHGVGELAADIRGLIEAARLRVAQTVNAELVLLYWQIGTRIRRDVLGPARAEYGEEIVSTLSRQLMDEYGAGFSRQNLFHMIRFAEAWPDQEQVAALAQHLGWSHFKEILYLGNGLARQFYAEMCRLERWSVRMLRDRVRGMMFERTAISRLPEATIRQDLQQLREADRLTPDLVFRDPYLLDFLGLRDTYSERDLEAAILRELERFLLELGTDFAFIARQKRMTIGSQDYYLDLLFYHRRLARLIAIDLKLGRFEAAGLHGLAAPDLEEHAFEDMATLPCGEEHCPEEDLWLPGRQVVEEAHQHRACHVEVSAPEQGEPGCRDGNQQGQGRDDLSLCILFGVRLCTLFGVLFEYGPTGGSHRRGSEARA